jgi:uncharacterized membrane protein YcaP (DUF421 family)
MEKIFQIDWRAVFVPSESIAEIVLRGTIVYLAIFLVLRFLRRESGTVSISDLVVVVIIADASQNAMAADYKSVTEGLILVGTIAFWDLLLDWLAYQFPRFAPLVHPRPLTLVEDGKMNRRNMRKELITEAELQSKLRQEGAERIEEVRRAYIEGDGQISVLLKNKSDSKS